jgi:putative DNA primase/helicase
MRAMDNPSAPPAGDEPRGRASDSIDTKKVSRARDADNRCRKAASAYARMGWPAFSVFGVQNGKCTCGNPTCGRPAKHPAVRTGFKAATTDELVLDALFADCPGANVAVATGYAFWTLDVDLLKGGYESLAELERGHDPLPDTVTSQTGGGGKQVSFAWDPDRPVPCSVGILPGIDVRGTGGYVVVPPSLHISGRRYAFLIGYGPHEIALAVAPEWLLNLVLQPPRRARLRRDPGIPLALHAGERNDGLFRIACRLRGLGLNWDAILASVVATNRHHCLPPLEDGEVIQIARSAVRYPAGSGERDRQQTGDNDAVIAHLLGLRR